VFTGPASGFCRRRAGSIAGCYYWVSSFYCWWCAGAATGVTSMFTSSSPHPRGQLYPDCVVPYRCIDVSGLLTVATHSFYGDCGNENYPTAT
jgi:hypothetical protein